jgi:hypothetical protein
VSQIQRLIAAVMNAAASRLTVRPIAPPAQFLGQHTNPKRNEERQLMRALGGRRQYKKRMHAARGAR